MNNNNETMVIFYNKVEGYRKVPFISGTTHFVTNAMVDNELAIAAQINTFSSPYGISSVNANLNHTDPLRLGYIVMLISIAHRFNHDFGPLSGAERDRLISREFSRTPHVRFSGVTLDELNVTIKDGEIHIYFR